MPRDVGSYTDRDHYRSGDRVNLWGVVRARASGTVPATVTVQLTPYSYDDDAIRPPVASVDLKPGGTGAFTQSLPLTGLADGFYTIELKIGSEVVALVKSTEVSIAAL